MRAITILFLASLPMLASDQSRPEFTGTWRVDAASSQVHTRIPGDMVWKIDQKDEDIHFAETAPERGESWEVTCGTRGADCKVKDSAKVSTVSFWYNGPALVEMETLGKGEAVTKKKMQLSPDGSTLTVEITHILPEGRGPEKLVLKKQQ